MTTNNLSQAHMDARYPECYAFTRKYEGGYVDHPSDPGGCTNKGVTIGTLSSWRGTKCTCTDVKNLSDEEAGAIYAKNYWAPVKGNDLPVGLNLCVWDWGVNSGPRRSAKALQKMVGCAADGAIGPNTVKAVNAYVAREGIVQTIVNFTQARQAFYESLGTFGTFGKGWTRRNEACKERAVELATPGTGYKGGNGDSATISAPHLPLTSPEKKASVIDQAKYVWNTIWNKK